MAGTKFLRTITLTTCDIYLWSKLGDTWAVKILALVWTVEAVVENQGRGSDKWAVSNLLNVFWSKSIFWQIDENVNTGSDHEVILFSIQSEGNLVENPLGKMPYNLEKADWKEFHKKLKDSSSQAKF